jgi:cytidylate kinase
MALFRKYNDTFTKFGFKYKTFLTNSAKRGEKRRKQKIQSQKFNKIIDRLLKNLK